MQNLETIDNIYTILSLKDSEGVYNTYSVRHNQTQVLYLIEVYPNNIPANLMNIMNNLIALNHPNIIHTISNGNGPIVLNNHPQGNRPYILYENVAHSTLFEYIGIQRFTERQAKWIFKKILKGVEALHNANICHRNLKPENILLDENYNPKIYNFYFSCMNMNNLQENLGTLCYKAPEVLTNQPYNGNLADIFSLGQILFNIVTGIHGFHSARQNDQFYGLIIAQHIAQYWQLVANQAHLNLSQNFKNLFINMVAPVPAQRPTIVQILNDPWMQEINNLTDEEMNALENIVRNEFQIREGQVQHNQQIVNLINNDNNNDNAR